MFLVVMKRKCNIEPKLVWNVILGFIIFLIGMGFFIFSLALNWLLVAGIGLMIVLISYIPIKLNKFVTHCEF